MMNHRKQPFGDYKNRFTGIILPRRFFTRYSFPCGDLPGLGVAVIHPTAICVRASTGFAAIAGRIAFSRLDCHDKLGFGHVRRRVIGNSEGAGFFPYCRDVHRILLF